MNSTTKRNQPISIPKQVKDVKSSIKTFRTIVRNTIAQWYSCKWVLRLSVVDNSAPRPWPLDNPNSLPYPSQELPAFLTACREVAHDDQFGLVCVPAGGMDR